METQVLTFNTTTMLSKIKHAIIGMDLGKSDQPMLKFLSYFGTKYPIEKATFIHVVPSFELYAGEQLEDFILLSKDIASKMGKQLKGLPVSQSPQKDEYIVTEGNPLDELTTIIEKNQADLVVVGKSTGEDNHGILLKNLVRKTTCNVLVSPDQARPQLKHILVPFDFSQNSIKSLKTALALKAAGDTEVKVTALNVYELPSIQTYRIGKTEAQVKQFLMEDRKEAFRNFLQTYFSEEERSALGIELVELKHSSVANAIMKFANQHKVDFIVQGAKGHSKVGLLLLGSVTEGVLSITEKIPVLVVR